MTIASEIQRIQGNINNAYNACINKGATLPLTQNSFSLASTIDTISTGSTINNQDLTIVSNGVYTADEGYTGLGTVTVAVPSSEGLSGLDLSQCTNGMTFYNMNSAIRQQIKGEIAWTNATNLQSVDFSSCNIGGELNLCNVTIMNNCAFGYTNIVGVNFNSLVNIVNTKFFNCTNLQSVNFPLLVYGPGSNGFAIGFQNCTNLQSAAFPNLSTVLALYQTSGNEVFRNAFKNCISLTSVDFSNLQKITPSSFLGAFTDCISLQNISFPSLANASGATSAFNLAFSNCTSLRDVYFPSYNSGPSSIFTNMLSGCSDVTLHFNSGMQGIIETYTTYDMGFGGTNTTILYDL
jgi:hypothetical protein